MGKLAKPQRSKKHKKLKAVDPFYAGDRKDRLYVGLNQKPKTLSQEVPKKLARLQYMVDDAKSTKSGKKGSFHHVTSPDAPIKYDRVFDSPMGEKSTDAPKRKVKKRFMRKIKDDPTMNDPQSNEKKGEKRKKKKAFKTEDVEEYIDNLKPVNDFVDKVEFKQGKRESQMAFMRRVDAETQRVVTKAKLADHFDISEEKKIALMVKRKSKMNDKKKERLSDKKKLKAEAAKQKKLDRLSDFGALQDKVEFGEVVHAPPVLTTRPKKATKVDHDKPALRMPELLAAIEHNIQEASGKLPPPAPRQPGQTRKSKLLSKSQRRLEDSRREDAVAAYRLLKKGKLKSH